MRSCGIVCEYNPFHNGHIHHIEETRKKTNPDVLVCVMSGNFVQRGEPAIVDKWQRAQCAVEHGVDVVFELPFLYALQSANYFAHGAISALKLAKVNDIVFGSESNNIDVLHQLSSITSQEIFRTQEISPAKAYERLYGTLNANDILGINYLKELEGSDITAHTIQRTNCYHEEHLNQRFSSATSIRKAIAMKETWQKETPMQLQEEIHWMKEYYPLIQMLLLTFPSERLHELFLMDEGIEYRLIKNAKKCMDYDSFIQSSISKCYTRSKIQRTLIHLMMHTTKVTVNTMPKMDTLRLLAYNEKGRNYLKWLKQQEVKIASRFNQIPKPYRLMEYKAACLYSYPFEDDIRKKIMQKELSTPIFIKKEN